jgi:IS5 family transposase
LRTKKNTQSELNFQPSNLEITNEYYAKYGRISAILDDNPGIVEAIHHDLDEALEEAAVEDRHGATFKYTSDTVLRILLCQIIEGCSLREIVIRVDDSNFLRFFVRICNGPMIDFTTFCRLKNRIKPETWKQVNELLARAAVEARLIDGGQLRLDTTAVETNIHWPTDSALLWDTYRTLARYIERIREIDPVMVGDRRLLIKKVKKLQQQIARQASKHSSTGATLEPPYIQLIGLVENIHEWSGDIATALAHNLARHQYSPLDEATMEFLLQEMLHYRVLGEQVIDQARRRIIDKEQVPNEEKIFSIFEPHTELLKRGKAAKPIEFGHMIQIGQVDGKFITEYEVFETKPVEYKLIEPALEHHERLFGDYPDTVAADKGYYENMAQIEHWGKKIEVVAIAKKGKRTEEQTQRETDPAFRHGQRFRAGVEGSISFLKRVLGLFRCYNKGWEHYVATVGATILAHNLLILARC